MKNIGFVAIIMVLVVSMYADTIYLQSGSPRNDVVVTKENFDKVHYYFKETGAKSMQSMEQSRIKRIYREEIPASYSLAKNYLAQKAYKKAIKEYERELRNKNWTEQHCLFGIAESYRLQEKYKNAIKAYSKLNRSFPNGRYLADAYFNQGICYLEQGNWEKAAKAYKKAAGKYNRINNTEKKIDAMYQAGYSYEKKNDYNQAQKIYNGLVDNVDKKKHNKMYYRADVRIGLCLIAKRDYAKGKRHLLRIIKNKKMNDPAVLSVAYLGLGDYYLNNSGESDAKKSLLCYLRVILMYSGNTEEAIKAYKGAASCFKLQGNNSKAKQMERQASRLGS